MNPSQARLSCACVCIGPALVDQQFHHMLTVNLVASGYTPRAWVWETEALCTFHPQLGSDAVGPLQLILEASHKLFPSLPLRSMLPAFPLVLLGGMYHLLKTASWLFLPRDCWK